MLVANAIGTASTNNYPFLVSIYFLLSCFMKKRTPDGVRFCYGGTPGGCMFLCA